MSLGTSPWNSVLSICEIPMVSGQLLGCVASRGDVLILQSVCDLYDHTQRNIFQQFFLKAMRLRLKCSVLNPKNTKWKAYSPDKKFAVSYLVMVVDACDPRTWEVEAGESVSL